MLVGGRVTTTCIFSGLLPKSRRPHPKPFLVGFKGTLTEMNGTALQALVSAVGAAGKPVEEPKKKKKLKRKIDPSTAEMSRTEAKLGPTWPDETVS